VRWLYRTAGLIVTVILIAGAYQLLFGERTVAPHLVSSRPVALIGSESGEPVAVAADGTVLTWFPVPKESSLPSLPLSEPPKSGRLAGTALQQARVLGAIPAGLRPYVERSYYGESGVDVILNSGIELRFGDASQVGKKWRAAAAVLADPSVTALDYVDLHAPGRPAIWGSGHYLPAAP
jgi:hypothetical protein